MNCERIREQIPEVLAGRLDKSAREKLVEHLEGCAGCHAEVAELNVVWRGMENLKAESDDAPQAAAKARFHEVLAAYEAGMAAAQTGGARVVKFPARPVWQIGMAAGLLAAGIFAGRYLPGGGAGNTEMAQLKGQVEGLRQMVALSMLQGQSPSARMRGVTYSEQISQPDRQVRDALLQAVNHDSNVNVRLSAVDALQKFAADPELTRAMVDSIPAQDTPLVQIALIDLLVDLKVTDASAELKRLTTETSVDSSVRERAKWALGKLVQ